MAHTLAPESTFLHPGATLTGRLLAEGIGTFVLVFAGCGAVMVDAQTGGALGHVGICAGFGLAVMAVVYAIGHISGAHINPAVSVGLAATGHFPWRDVPFYVVAQCVGALTAALTLSALLGTVAGVGATMPQGGVLSGVVIEVVITAILMFVIAGVATDQRAVPGNVGLVVGGTVTLLALFAGPLTGASMNPARSLGPALANGDLHHIWVYLVAPTVGAVLGGMMYELTRLQK